MNYTPTTYLEQQQHLVQSLNTLMISLVISVTIVSIVSAFLQRNDKTVFIALLFAAAAFAACIIISRFNILPIQNEMLTWKADSLPGNWTTLRDKWWSLHIMRTMAELIALILVAWATSKTTKYA